jgi:SAM-dependent methyltransferase
MPFPDRIRTELARFLARLMPAKTEPESKLIRDAEAYWTDPDSAQLSSNSHWSGSGPFQDGALWQKLGTYHAELIGKAERWVGRATSLDTALEWGCGGGMNAVQLAPGVHKYYGVDISPASLKECARQLDAVSCGNFQPILLPAETPELVTESVPEPVDLFLCTYVYELFPTPEYGIRVLQIARRLLKNDGLALLQIRYSDGSPAQRSKYRRYTDNLAQMTTYRLDEFWANCEQAGFRPLFVVLLPEQPELREKRYAYFALQACPE